MPSCTVSGWSWEAQRPDVLEFSRYREWEGRTLPGRTSFLHDCALIPFERFGTERPTLAEKKLKTPSRPINYTLPQRALVFPLRNIPTRWKSSPAPRVLLLPFNVVLKRGRHVSLSEVHKLAFVSKNTQIPFPRVTTAFESKSGPHCT